jgi:hypothetical protein
MTAMTLFLLTAVPLAAVAVHCRFYPGRPAFTDVWPWIRGGVWAAASLVAAAFFGSSRVFQGDLAATFFGLTFTDVILVPGGVVAAWMLTTRRDPWELGLWLALTLTFAGIRDTVSASRVYDLNEYFLVPLDRMLVMTLLPGLIMRALAAADVKSRARWIAAASGLGLTLSLFPVLSFANLGWLVWAAELGGLAAVWFKKWGVQYSKV